MDEQKKVGLRRVVEIAFMVAVVGLSLFLTVKVMRIDSQVSAKTIPVFYKAGLYLPANKITHISGFCDVEVKLSARLSYDKTIGFISDRYNIPRENIIIETLSKW